MKVFHCDHCDHLVFFESVMCVVCEHTLAYLPDLGVTGSLDQSRDGLWTSPLERARGKTYRLCQNYTEHAVCNWAVPADDPDPYCQSCRLTRVIPNLSNPANKAAWYKLELAKRRLLYTLIALKLPLVSKAHDPAGGLAFEFLADPEDPSLPRVLTGHADGLITVNLAEADDAERERRRTQMHEPYRTVLGHFRHEVGHHYWNVLIRDGGRLESFRDVFGDERADYGAALQQHYATGAPSDWQNNFISAYATAHPWEDWAETWAHYLHMVDALETAVGCGISIRPRRADEPSLKPDTKVVSRTPSAFDAMIASWHPLTYVLNNLNRGLGQPDGYPFVISEKVVEKLRFVHDVTTAPQPAPKRSPPAAAVAVA
ncbi:hypothetical protein GobsT_39790 [Gemmata obscuriglobus]|uniref:Zinc-ribbon domain-containing protein n=1 Tax=Gemmata obscuriglobus TaxID=114 RepID=A0A2Z3GW48_9BACT|nr:putative zinc-binding peptidase [Gemmata obscuriglobus]AWM37953.1 hypothetical protein C1280_13770 [Gemmata obscuriglobus]QEG29189.1 hypothetical protein GobsT_39790 [Gemmata obscuriglobus]VTS07953.1 Uncharacterized protein OS=Hydrocarboniphaga effusa AP103 GN=WQQ_33450 PE=4 SV=1: DUF2248 [Gemmata obscuriglobus UQM 2246]